MKSSTYGLNRNLYMEIIKSTIIISTNVNLPQELIFQLNGFRTVNFLKIIFLFLTDFDNVPKEYSGIIIFSLDYSNQKIQQEVKIM